MAYQGEAITTHVSSGQAGLKQSSNQSWYSLGREEKEKVIDLKLHHRRKHNSRIESLGKGPLLKREGAFKFWTIFKNYYAQCVCTL